MKTFNADEVMRRIEWMFEINQTPLAEIKWVNDKGEEIKVDPKVMDEWRFVGLNNKDFVDCVLFGNFEEAMKQMKMTGEDTLTSKSGQFKPED